VVATAAVATAVAVAAIRTAIVGLRAMTANQGGSVLSVPPAVAGG